MNRITKYIIALFIISFIGILNGFAQPGFGQAEKINTDWQFHLGDVDLKEAFKGDKKNWKNVSLPHDWSIKQSMGPSYASASGYLPGGIGWYEKKLDITTEDKGKKLYLYFEGVYNRSEVFVNGQSIGKRPNGYISFCYDISPFIKYGQENLISVRVDHSKDPDSRWYTGSGIYRDVWLVRANPVHIQQWGVYAYPQVRGKKATLNVSVEMAYDKSRSIAAVRILGELLDKSGEVVAKKEIPYIVNSGRNGTAELPMEVNSPKIWNLETPYNYTLRIKVKRNGVTIDSTSITTGFRTFTFDPDKGFALNGQWMKVKGVCLHHDAGVLGSAFYTQVWRRRLLTLKSLGVNAIRTSHNPQSSSLYSLCDEIGLLVMDEAFDEWEFPKRKWLEGWNIGTPGFQGTSDFFKEWGEKDLADMVKRDRNHLSIFAWSIGNEVDYPNDPYSHPVLAGTKEGGFTQPIFGGYKKDAPDAMQLGDIAKKLAAVVRKYDTSRPVTAGLAGVAMSNETAYPSELDIAGYNYTESRYSQDHKRYPKRVIFGSENRHEFSAWKSVRDNEYIFGQFLWTGIDYLGESGRWPSRGFYSGLLDFAGFIKPRGYFRKSLWTEKPMAYLGSYPLKDGGNANDVWSVLESEQGEKKNKTPSMDAWPIWNYTNEQLIRVVCYSNAAKMQLTLNGEVVGKTKEYDQKDGIVYWDIPFSPGKLEVIGFDESGKEVIRENIKTSKRQNAIRILQGEVLKVDAKNGLAQIELQIIDEDNVPVLIADDEITCNLIGSARLLGMEAGDNADMGNYTDNKQRVYHGRMIIYIQTNGKANEEVSVKLTAPWLKSAIIKLKLL